MHWLLCTSLILCVHFEVRIIKYGWSEKCQVVLNIWILIASSPSSSLSFSYWLGNWKISPFFFFKVLVEPGSIYISPGCLGPLCVDQTDFKFWTAHFCFLSTGIKALFHHFQFEKNLEAQSLRQSISRWGEAVALFKSQVNFWNLNK